MPDCRYVSGRHPRNRPEAFEWFQRAAAHGEKAGMYSAGFMLEYGQGVNHDYEQALKYYEQAAEPGDVDAMYRAGLIYANLDGKYRTTSIPEKAGGFERSDQTDTSGFVRRDQDNTGESVCSDTVESYTGTSSDVTGVWYVRKAKQGDLELDTSINA